MHNFSLVQIYHCLDDLLDNGAQSVYILDLVVRQCVHILLNVATCHELQENRVFLFIRIILSPNIEQVFDDARMT